MVAEHTEARSVCSAQDASERFEELLQLVAKGETVEIVSNGRVVAELKPGPPSKLTAEERKAAVAKFREERAEWEPLNATLEELMAWRHEGHRWRADWLSTPQ